MTTRVSIEWRLEELPDYDRHGRKLCRVIETDHRDSEAKSFVLPCVATAAFIRARRERIARTMKDEGAFRVEDHFDLPPKLKD